MSNGTVNHDQAESFIDSTTKLITTLVAGVELSPIRPCLKSQALHLDWSQYHLR